MSEAECELLRRELVRQKAARKEAERLLEQKSLELYQRNLELERQIAERARINDELEQFAYVASHDLKAPLRSVASFAQLLMRRHASRLDGEAAEFLGFIDTGVRRMHSMIEDLLEYARASKVPLHCEWFEAGALLDTVREALRATLRTRRAQVHAEALPRIWGDRVRLQQLLQNLIDNAIKFQPTGQAPVVQLEVRVEADHWLLGVRDNGIGIAAEQRERIFGLFQRLHAEDAYEGTGLGLCICRKIMERHGGALWVEPVQPQGSCFWIRLPRPPPA